MKMKSKVLTCPVCDYSGKRRLWRTVEVDNTPMAKIEWIDCPSCDSDGLLGFIVSTKMPDFLPEGGLMADLIGEDGESTGGYVVYHDGNVFEVGFDLPD